MLQFYVKFAAILHPFRKLITITGFVALLLTIVLLIVLSEVRSAVIFLCLSVSLLSLMLYLVSEYFLDFPTSIGDTKGIIKRLRLRIRLAVAWVFSVVMTLVIFKIILLSLQVVKLE